MKNCRRATVVDDEYGTVCPVCAGPKREQSLRCRDCFNDWQRSDYHWQVRTCPDCGGPKSRQARRCIHCDHLFRQPSEGTGRPQRSDHPWRRSERARVTERTA